MNTENENVAVSKALLEVWDWKLKAYNELQAQPKENRMQAIKKNTQEVIDAIVLAKKKLLKSS
jgi:hypothetical protein